ncbi:probable glutathione peroxidase 2 [Sipha flava]|uniref:Glutathione peroxidase n=1 Tax=Sipha flava TaxID=143950 RepID=A0A8B8F3X6_9HEMI|nr:probable glutathione peroxidase 2 [Sipha flava]
MNHNVCTILFFAVILLWTSQHTQSCKPNSPPSPPPPPPPHHPPHHPHPRSHHPGSESTSSCADEDYSGSSTSVECAGSTVYSYTVKDVYGEDICLQQYSGKVLLIVNYAESCGLTDKNVKGLKALSKKYKSQGLVILIFPSNSFDENPRGNEAGYQLAEKYPEFVVCSEVDVNGSSEEPLYKYLKKTTSTSSTREIEWNFTKFLVNKQGVPVRRFSSTDDFDCIESSVIEEC